MNRKHQELTRFIASGILAVTSDFSSYYLLLEHLSTDAAKSISFIIGSIVSFFMNKLWTFESQAKIHSALLPFIALYSLTFIANVSANHLILLIFNNMSVLAFLIATGTSTVLNFIGMKFWVFKVAENNKGIRESHAS